MMCESVFGRNEFYTFLQEALFEYSVIKRSVEMEIFAVEMEVAPGKTDSADPALLDEFRKAFPQKVTWREAFLLAAEYVQRELIGLRHIDAANGVVEDLRKSAEQVEATSEILKRVFSRRIGLD